MVEGGPLPIIPPAGGLQYFDYSTLAPNVDSQRKKSVVFQDSIEKESDEAPKDPPKKLNKLCKNVKSCYELVRLPHKSTEESKFRFATNNGQNKFFKTDFKNVISRMRNK